MTGAMRAVSLVVALAACGSRAPAPRSGGGEATTAAPTPDAAPAPVPLEQDYPRLAAMSADLLVALAEALSGDGKCAELADRGRAVLDGGAEVRAATSAAVDAGHGAELDAALEAHAARIATAAATMQPNLERCAGDPSFASALTAFEPAPR
jgi:hypothetical protein